MNKLIRFYDTPTGITKMVEDLTDATVSAGASSKGNAKQWETLTLRVTSDGDGPRFHLAMDRETAAKVVDHLRAYLDEVKS